MKIFDCFMYFDEEVVLDLRLNVLDKYVDYFVIVESNFTHRGEKRSLKFNHKKFEKFKNKIIYLIYDEEPKKIAIVNESDSKKEKSIKYILNAALRENGQRDHIIKGLEKADENDFILISDVDEIPNLSNIDFKNIKEKILMFQQEMFYYKFDLKLPDIVWSGTKACRKKYLLSPQWLRNIKDRKYSLFRLDIIFSKKKYSSIKFIKNGGWHFSNIKSAREIEHKLRSYLHHREFDEQPLTIDEIDNIIQNRQAIYDLKVDKRVNKVGNGSKLIKYNFEKLPNYLKENKEYYQKWLD
jgi:beta-1,4-mannosyl-glycoprotein beta-1,4-N-acetylglucosaminyltransferase|tara:strand:+ start:403 stop:1293 length:891 start_codon:yes stop_codon:yes gene_type:complete